ncbi:MAG: (2Fe-2S) ferredoxin domain-containing protein [Deltaproteobacteria bacterium]|nr:(2Fe-2S) ferredoxin domain-containing protein [Deltaproteobacteria bacterium]
MPRRQRYLFVCTNRRPEGHPKGSCATSGSEQVHAALKEQLADRGMARTAVRACTSSCLDVCHLGPVVAVEPDGYFYGRVRVEDVPEIVDALERGERVGRLVIPDDQYDEPPKKRDDAR